MKLNVALLLLSVSLMTTSCSKSVVHLVRSAQPNKVDVSEPGKAMAIMFLDIDCPISQYAAKPFQTLNAQHSETIQFIGVIPGDYYSSEKIDSFMTAMKLDFILIPDTKNKLVKRLGATITPEVFLIDGAENVIYQGALDDKYKALGRARQEVSERYLERAISALVLGTPIELSKTDPIGCKIEL